MWTDGRVEAVNGSPASQNRARIAFDCRMVGFWSHMTSKIFARNGRGQKAELAAWLLAIFTGVVAIFTAALVAASFLTIREDRRAASEQLGLRTWLYVDPKFNSQELKLARKHLAE